MQDRVAGVVENLPDHPGVYIMKNALGRVIYVGKAISLRSRVRNYFQASTQREYPKTRRLVQDIADIDYVLVKDEREALMLECNLIKQHQPHYNILLKDGKHYPYLRVDLSEDFPQVELVRKLRRGDKARYFGPYMSTGSLRATLDAIKKIFPIRSCTKDVMKMVRNGERPCLNAQIGLCMAPCTGKVTPEEYAAVMRQVCSFLQGHQDEVAADLKRKMEEAAEALDFEKAAAYRDKLQAVQLIYRQGDRRQSVISTAVYTDDVDVIGVVSQNEQTAVQLMMMRGGRVTGSEGFLMDGAQNEESAQVAGSFIAQFYLEAPSAPQEILVRERPEDADALEEALREKWNRKVTIHAPQRGEKRALLLMAEKNAQEKIQREWAYREREWERTGGAVKALGEVLGIPPPQRIECYDISNFQGTDSVASMVVFEGGKPARSAYRRFKIKTVEGANDFESMKEVLGRRFRHGLEERAELDKTGGDYAKGSFSKFPDLVLIDGGPIQLEFARESMEALGVGAIPAVGLAKRFEHIIRVGHEEPLALPHSSPTLQLLQRVRDEAHRFAITYHRSLRAARTLRSQLEDIPGVGEKRRKALLRAYPVPALMKQATVEELAELDGMNAAVAQKVYDALHAPQEDSGEQGEQA
ncbi:MAG: excinuclease ABC subunit UvrC [Eubacteriales bacterium]|nr:excinuclease ABC subunit UvrC [Eubacteriales bacterium]